VRFALKQNLAYLYPQNLDVPFFTFTGMFLRDRDDLPIFCEISKKVRRIFSQASCHAD
jgi:hypothetical protein